MNWRMDMSHIQYSTISNIFSQFLVLVRAYSLLALNYTTEEIKMDNAAIYVSKMSQLATSNLNLIVYWLPQFSLTFEPVELVFGMIKKMLASMNSNILDRRSKEDVKKFIAKWIGELDSKAGFKM